MTDYETYKEKLVEAREKVAGVWEKMVNDDGMDNGNLTSLNNAVLLLNNGIAYCNKHIEDDG